MNRIFTTLVFAILLSLNLPADILMPVKADAKAEKSVLRPGETVKITLLNFRDMDNKPVGGGERIIVRSNAGLIMDGTDLGFTESESPQLIGSTKAFLLGSEGRIEVYYRAPLRGESSDVEIEVFNSPTYGSTADKTLESTIIGQVITNTKLKIKWGTYFLLQYEENKKSKRGSVVEYKHEIKSVIRIDCQPWQAGSMLQVTDLQVLEFNGRADLIGSDYHEVQKAVSAEPFAYNFLVLLSLDPENQAIRGIIYEPIPLNVDWQGDEIPEGPPDVVNVGPVSKYKENPWDAGWQGVQLEDEFPGEGKDAKRIRRMQQFVLRNFSETQVHPDHFVKGGDGKTFFTGQGIWEKSSGSNFHHKTYTWELHITDK